MHAHHTMRHNMKTVMHIFSPLAGLARHVRQLTASLSLALALALAGCATAPPPDGSMNQAQNQLQLARDAGAADYAPVDLDFAQNKFQQAQAAMVKQDYRDAAKLATESAADAELAQAKAKLGAARAQVQSKVKENSRLRAEGDRDAAGGSMAPRDMPTRPSLDPVPAQDMPAYESSTSPPPAGGGFQAVPQDNPPTDPYPQEKQP
jgi:hypothetical protein